MNIKDMAISYQNGNVDMLDFLVEMYYEKIGKKFILEYPEKKDKEKCAYELLKLGIENYLKNSKDIYKFSSYLNSLFRIKYQKFELGDNLEETINTSLEYKDSKILKILADAKNGDWKSYEYLYNKYYYIVDKYCDIYVNKDRDYIESLYKDILDLYLKSDSKEYLSSYFSLLMKSKIRNYEHEKEFEVKKRPRVKNIINKAKDDKESLVYIQKLMIKYYYLVESLVNKIDFMDIDEARSRLDLRYAQIIHNYINNDVKVNINIYITSNLASTFELLKNESKKQKVENIYYVDDYVDQINDFEDIEYLDYLFKNTNLSDRELKILNMYSHNYTYEKIGEEIGVSRQRVEQIKNSACEKLKRHI